jgi:hypothetical protein
MQVSSKVQETDTVESRLDKVPDVKVPAAKRVSIGIAIAFALASVFFLLFAVGIGQIYGYAISYIIIAFSLFGFDPLVSAIMMSLIFLFLATVFTIIARRGSTALAKIDAGTRIQIDDTPTDYYDLGEVPTENLVREFVGNNKEKDDKGRGCKLLEKVGGKGFDISCPNFPLTASMQALAKGKIELMDWKQRGIMLGVFALLGGIFCIVTYMHVLTGVYLYIIWGLYLVSFLFAAVETGLLRLWGVVIAWGIINLLFLFMSVDVYFFWIVVGAWICFSIAAAIFYMLKKNACVEKRSWYCDFL